MKPVACRNEYQITVPKNRKPRLRMSELIASDISDDVGIDAMSTMELTILSFLGKRGALERDDRSPWLFGGVCKSLFLKNQFVLAGIGCFGMNAAGEN